MSVLLLRLDLSTRPAVRFAHASLLPVLQQHQAQASFMLNAGGDDSGRSWRYAWPRRKALGWGGLWRGRFWPAARLAECEQGALRELVAAGFEFGLLGGSDWRWRQLLATPPRTEAPWVAALESNMQAFERVFAHPPRLFAAPDEAMSRIAYRLLQRYGFQRASCSLGRYACYPVIDAEPVRCALLPVTRRWPLTADSLDGLLAAGEPAQLAVAVEDLMQPGQLDAFAVLLAACQSAGVAVQALGGVELADDLPWSEIDCQVRPSQQRGVFP